MKLFKNFNSKNMFPFEPYEDIVPPNFMNELKGLN
jgi:hypothetical protein